MATTLNNLNASNSYILFYEGGNEINQIQAIGTNSFNTIDLPKNGGVAQLDIDIGRQLVKYGVIKKVTLSYKAYGTRTGILGSKAQVRTGYWNYSGGGYEIINVHGDVGRGSSNASSYTDTIENPNIMGGMCTLFIRCTNPIATQTNKVYVYDINISLEFEQGTVTVKVTANPTSGGTVTGAGTFLVGDSGTYTANLQAIPATGYEIDYWTAPDAGGQIYQSQSSITISIYSGGTLDMTAHFKKREIKACIDKNQIANILIDKIKIKKIFKDKNIIYEI